MDGIISIGIKLTQILQHVQMIQTVQQTGFESSAEIKNEMLPKTKLPSTAINFKVILCNKCNLFTALKTETYSQY